jgi:hypothetical protein
MGAGVPDPAGRALKAEWDYNVLGESFIASFPVLVEADILVVKLELPIAIQVQPILALKLRLGILGARRAVIYSLIPGWKFLQQQG